MRLLRYERSRQFLRHIMVSLPMVEKDAYAIAHCLGEQTLSGFRPDPFNTQQRRHEKGGVKLVF
jgi:hypothetical protein